ncbi:TlpA disulfide reductase family protein [Pedobacter sp. MC2016-24]|uniref:TlpA family protein disulfide reductase n=1 Tax=Pedobacter sp. MC2016-24 TaxID=2780090 RepID=UPI0018814823|nr:TlpA disulfide reductase family protein [Pedobacter sp. MC2016-24]MBE9597849.1 TlpA family protein disulfide reductase [Pedobacter sp. MC2016-24]
MKKILLTIVLATLCLFFKADAQSQDDNNIKPLNIGDAIPEDVWNMALQVVNHPTGKKANTLNAYKGKLIILDFWATWCSSCIAAMPSAHKLQTKLSDSLVILPVTNEEAKKAEAFLKSNATVKALNLASVVTDRLLEKLFPHQLIPHYIWIDQSGTIAAITGAEELNIQNVRKVLMKRGIELTTKTDFNLDRPLFIDNDANTKNILAYSILTKGYQSGLPGGTTTRQSQGITNRRVFTNSSLLTIYRVAALNLFRSRHDAFTENRLILEVAKSEALEFDKKRSNKEEWESEHCFNYDVMVPVDQADQLYEQILTGLNLSTSYYARIEKRKVDCLLLSIRNRKRKISSVYSDQAVNLEFYSYALNSLDFITHPVINETGITDQVKSLASRAKSMNELEKELQEKNLVLTLGSKEINMLVISDKNNPFPNPTNKTR